VAIKDTNVLPTANIGLECIRLAIGTTATGQTAKIPDAVKPGFDFRIVRVEVNALTVTATISVDVLIGSTSCLTGAVTPVAATPTLGTLSTTLANVCGISTDTLNVAYTSNGSGAATNGIVSVWIRPQPMNGEVRNT
jgi:hypothetical protein